MPCDCPCHANERALPEECFCTPECIRGDPPEDFRTEVLQRWAESQED